MTKSEGVCWMLVWRQNAGSCRITGRRENIKESGRGWLCTAAALAIVGVGAATPVRGQTGNQDDSRPQSRSLILSPTFELTDVGWDDNVFRVSKTDNPIGDFTATARAVIEPSLRLRRLRLSGRSKVDFIYFKQLSHIRSIDTDNAAHVDLLLGRLTPYVGGEWADTRHRRNLEIDLPIRHVDSRWDAGIDLRLSGKTSIGVMTRGSSVDYKGETVYLDTDLARYLGASATADGARFRYALTPLTTVGAVVEQDRNEFPAVAERNSNGVLLMSIVEFQPLALVSGRVQIGIRRRAFVDGKTPPFQGMVANFNLGYTLLGRTQIAVGGQRDLSYSYRADQRDYLQTGIELSVTHRLANPWDVVGTLARFRLLYFGAPSESVLGYGFGVGYRLDRTRVGFQVARQTRASEFSIGRYYEETRILSSLSYRF